MAASSSGLGGRAEGRQPGSSAATSWTARTCLHGPRSPRWRPYQGHVQCQPSAVERTRYSTPPGAATQPAMPGRVGRLDPNGTRLDEPARVAEAWLEALDAPEVERQLAPEEPAVGQVVADDPGQRERREGTRDLVARPPGRGREGVDPEPRLPAERTTDRGDGGGGRSVGQAVKRTTLAGEAAPDLGTEDERQSSARDVELPAGAAVTVRGEDPQRRRVSRDPVEQAQGGPDRQGRPRPVPDRGGTSAGRGRPVRPRPAASTGDFGIDRKNARVAGRVELGRRRELGLDRLHLEEPAQPARRQRDPPLDRRTPASVSTSTAAAPTASPSRPRSWTPARAVRIAGPKSTLVVPRPRVSPS